MAAVEEPGLRRYIRYVVIGMHQQFVRLMKAYVVYILLTGASVVISEQPREMRITQVALRCEICDLKFLG